MEPVKFTIIKASGQKEPFSEEKLRSSINRAGIPAAVQKEVATHVKKMLYENIPARQIYKYVSNFLAQSTYPAAAAKYSLKQAIMQLGPTGYPFEKFIAAVLAHYGYKVITNQIISGKCVAHEIDVIAQKDQKQYMIEAKFHNRPGTRSDIKTALYTWARFNDLVSFSQPWLVTNTKVTTEAIDYGRCMGMRILAWSYPKQNGLRDLIQQADLHPLTSLTTLTPKQQQLLFGQNIVLCRQLTQLSEQQLVAIGLSSSQAKAAKTEAIAICNTVSRQNLNKA